MNDSYLEEPSQMGGGSSPGLARSGFFEHVFDITDSSKADCFNIAQYSALAVIPIVLLNKSIAKWIPEADEAKGSPEIAIEVFSQVTVMFLGLLFIHRLVTYPAPYSGVEYPAINPITSVLGVLMILLSLQTNLGEKIAILSERAIDLWEGRSKKKKSKRAPPIEITTPPTLLTQGGGGGAPSTSYTPMPSMGTGGGGYEQQQVAQQQQLMQQEQQQQQYMEQPPEPFVPLPANAVSSAFGTALGGGW